MKQTRSNNLHGNRAFPGHRTVSGGEALPGKDYTAEILDFLQNSHGKVRVDSHGDHFYESVSTISLHFLLRSPLPGKELLWRWYQYFDGLRSESIYQTLPPQRDEEFLEILSTCAFEWNPEKVRQSGLVFLSQHRTEVYVALEEFMGMRLEAYETMNDAELAEVLTAHDTWSDVHLRKMVRRIQTGPPSEQERQSVYALFDSEYLKATARHLLDEVLSDAFWKSPPPELEGLHSRFIIFARTMTNTARRLGVYVARKDFDRQQGFSSWDRQSTGTWGNNRQKTKKRGVSPRHMELQHFDALGLAPDASLLDVKTAYREMVKQHHPDQGGSVQEFLKLQEAYEYLLTQVF